MITRMKHSGTNESNSTRRSCKKCPLASPKQLINKRHSSLNPEDHRKKVFTTKWSKHPPTGSRRYSSSLRTVPTNRLLKAYLNIRYPASSLSPREKLAHGELSPLLPGPILQGSGGRSSLLLALQPGLTPHPEGPSCDSTESYIITYSKEIWILKYSIILTRIYFFRPKQKCEHQVLPPKSNIQNISRNSASGTHS